MLGTCLCLLPPAIFSVITGASTTVPANDFLEQSTTVSTAHSTEHRGMLKCLRLVFGHCTFPAVQIAKAGGGCFRQFPPGQMKQLP